MLSDEWLSRYGLLENFNASVTRTRTGTGTGTGTWTTEVTAIALCTSCSRAKNQLINQNAFENFLLPDWSILVDLCHHLISSLDRAIVTNLCDVVSRNTVTFTARVTGSTLVHCVTRWWKNSGKRTET